MPYRICKTIEVENGHMLSKHPGNCKYPHGHSRQVELVLESEQLDHNDMVCDFSIIKIVLKDFLDSFDHAMCMNTNDPMYTSFKTAYGDRIIGIDSADPTTEVIARMIFDRLSNSLKEYSKNNNQPYVLAEGVRLVRVRVWETSTSWAEYGEYTD